MWASGTGGGRRVKDEDGSDVGNDGCMAIDLVDSVLFMQFEMDLIYQVRYGGRGRLRQGLLIFVSDLY